MKTKNYSFYSEKERSFIFVKALNKKNVCIFAKNILKEDINNDNISIIKTGSSHQSSIEIGYPELYS